MSLTLEEKSTLLLDSRGRHSQPDSSVCSHGLCPQPVLHLSMEGWHGQLDGCRERQGFLNDRNCYDTKGGRIVFPIERNVTPESTAKSRNHQGLFSSLPGVSAQPGCMEENWISLCCEAHLCVRITCCLCHKK